MVSANKRLTCLGLSSMLNIPKTTVHRILKKDLGLTRKCAKFVPRLLNNRQRNECLCLSELHLRHLELNPGFLKKVITMDEAWVYMYDLELKTQSSQWLSKEEEHPRKALRTCATGKSLLVSFFDWKGVVYHEYVRGRTVNKHLFIQMLHRLRLAMRRRHPGLINDWWLHMDNAPAHKAKLTKMFLERTNTKVLPHPPYSLDMSPNDFWLYSRIKNPLRGRRFANLDDLEEAVDRQIGLIPSADFAHCMLSSWPK